MDRDPAVAASRRGGDPGGDADRHCGGMAAGAARILGQIVVDAAIHLPLVLPPVVTGYLLLLTFGRRGLVGAWLADHLGIVFAFRWTGRHWRAASCRFRCCAPDPVVHRSDR